MIKSVPIKTLFVGIGGVLLANTKAPEGAVTGAVTGGVVVGALGWIAGIGALAIPGVGPCRPIYAAGLAPVGKRADDNNGIRDTLNPLCN